VRSVAAVLLLGLAAPAHAQLTVTYIANEGFLLEGGEHILHKPGDSRTFTRHRGEGN
jgi:hypothetical protein